MQFDLMEAARIERDIERELLLLQRPAKSREVTTRLETACRVTVKPSWRLDACCIVRL